MKIEDSVMGELEAGLTPDTLILGIGNSLRGDDACGSLLARALKERLRIKVIDAGSSPENYLGSIVKKNPALLLLVDAVDFGASPGEIKLFDLKDIKSDGFFMTHNPTPETIGSYLKSNCACSIWLLAVQPQKIAFCEDLSPAVEKRIEQLKGWFLKKYGR